MQNTSKKSTITSWLLVGTILSTCLVLMGTYIPRAFSQNVPFDYYLDIQSVVVDDVELPQDTQVATIAFDARKNLPAKTQTQLILKHIQNGRERIVSRTQKSIVFEKQPAQSTIEIARDIPTNVPTGEFIWVYNFTIDINGVKKSQTVRSNVFMITK